uniref:hypothetical protein n=1 Tax=Nitrobacter sp. TaxID=29420 RepID=UPI00321F7FD6
GIWAMLLLVHGLVLIMARLVVQLQDDDPPEVRLPVNDALLRESTSTWIGAEPPAPSPPPSADRVSWQAATDAAQMRRSEQTTPESNALLS